MQNVLIALAAGQKEWTGDLQVSDQSVGTSQHNPWIIKTSDENYIVFYESNNPDQNDIYARKISANGENIWASSVQMTDHTIDDNINDIVADSSGGAYVAYWTSDASDDSYLSHIDTDGTAWSTNGLQVYNNNTGEKEFLPKIIFDSEYGGVYLVWDANPDVYLARIKSNQTTPEEWNPSGTNPFRPVNIGTTFWDREPRIVNSGGLPVIVYKDESGNLAVHKLDDTGTDIWTPVSISARDGFQEEELAALPDSTGGVLIAYAAGNNHIHGIRIDSSGTLLWDTDAGQYTNNTAYLAAAGDGSGGLFMAWQHQENEDLDVDIYGQYLNSNGDAQWGLETPAPQPISNKPAYDEGLRYRSQTFNMISDNAGGYFIGITYYGLGKIGIQHVNADGSLHFAEGSYIFGFNSATLSLGFLTSNKVIAVWSGTETELSSDVYIWAQGISETSPCGVLRDNLEEGSSTISDQCVSLDVNGGGIYFSNLPKSFSFPIKYTTGSGQNQASFSNFDGQTGPNGLTDPFGNTQQVADEDVLTVTDLRNNNGFQVTITAEPFRNIANDEIPLNRVYLVTTYPTSNDLPLNPELLGTNEQGITYAQNSYGLKNISDTVDTTGSITQQITYTNFGRNFDQNNDGFAEPIVLMFTETAHAGSFSNALSFFLNIPGAQPTGTYSTLFTIDLMPGGGIQ